MGMVMPSLRAQQKKSSHDVECGAGLEGASYIQGAQVQVLVLPLTDEKVPSM